MTDDIGNPSEGARPAPARTITIRVAGAVAWTSAAVEPLLARSLEYTSTVFEDHDGQITRRQTDVRAYRVVDDFLQFPAGQVDTVQTILAREGYTVDVQQVAVAQSPLLEPYRPALDETNDLGRSFIAAIDRTQRGLIELPQGASVALWIALTVRWFLRARVIIPVPTLQMINELRRELFARYDHIAGRVSSRHDELHQRITLTTYGSYRYSNANDYQLVIFPDAETIPRTADDAWLHYTQHRMYGFLRERQRSEAEFARPRIYIGQEIFNVPAPRNERSTVHLQTVSYTASPRVISDEGLERKRAAIWHNEARNMAIAEVAQGLAERNLDRLGRYGLLLDRPLEYLEQILGPFRSGIVILVESTEHAQQLARLLPKWQLCSGTDTSATGIGNAIMTMVFANRLGYLPSNVLVRADGEAGPVPLGDFPPRVDACGPRNVLLVDLADEYDDTARAAVHARLTQYKACGYELDARAQHLLERGPPSQRRRRRR